jgi:hypothetical protein
MAYLLDSNTFIDAKNLYYRFSICPGFWKWLCRTHKRGDLLSIKQVRDEILQRNDELSRWCKQRKEIFVDTDDGETVESQKLLSTWVNEQYTPAAQTAFFRGADFTLVAFAHAHNHTVVTREVPAYGMAVKIPNACKEMNVPCMGPFDMLAREGASFDLVERKTTQKPN